ncbi:MAG: FHA domain-containing protein [Clostridiales bacterium]|nr:FHA domain-containing protein [Clostridiales bacterium]
MIDLNIKNDEEKVTAEYLLKSNDRIDNLTLGMMVNNDIEGFLPVQPVQVENDRYFRYDITGLVTMKEYLGEYVKKDRLLKVFYGIANTIRESSEYMINWTSFSLERKEIYVNPENGDVRLLCLPLLTVINDGNICNFFKNVLFSSQFDLDENGDYVGKLITFLNPKSYTLDKFIYELEDMLGLEHKEVVEEDDEEDEEDTVVEAETEEDIAVEAETEEDKNNADVEKEPAEDTKQEAANDGDAETQPELEENIAETSDEVIDEKVTEETIEIDEVSGKDTETEEVPPIVSKPEIEPYLIRLSNNQEIKIDKDSFYIGKDEENVDYCISDNLAIDDKHAYIIRHGKEYFVVDNNSKNHTYLNRVLIGTDEEIFIPHGAQLRFADEDFEFRMHK